MLIESLPAWEVLVSLIIIGVGAGLLGALLGLGGGLIVVPALVLLFDVDVHLAIAASLLSIVANSAASASRYTHQGVVNLRLGMFLESATSTGGVIGAVLTTTVLAGATGSKILLLAFVPITIAAAVLMWRTVGRRVSQVERKDPIAERYRLSGVVHDDETGQLIPYSVVNPKTGLMMSLGAGIVSGLLGIGGGIFKVPAMNAIMHVPIKVASATSSMMVGVTAVAGAVVFLLRGDVAPWLVAPVTLGAIGGSLLGARAHTFASRDTLKQLFVLVLIAAALLMGLKALGFVGAA